MTPILEQPAWAETTTCPWCGSELTAAQSCQAGCSKAGGCALVCCPTCGASFPNPRRSGLAYRLSRWMARRRQSPKTHKHTTGDSTP